MARAKKERAKYVAVIESLDQEGRGVARRDGKVVFIEGGAPRRESRIRGLPQQTFF